jgi:tRNA(Ile)-lysidine synthase
MSLLHHFESALKELGPFDPARPVVVGVSGGVDSAVLLALFRSAGYRVVAAHVNYGLRGADADADEAVVRANCQSSTLPPHVPLYVDRPVLGEGNVQAEARRARYAFFERVAAEVGASAIATAHHRDDQAETLLLHLFRGTGPSGLAGMPSRRPVAPDSDVVLIRPLLLVGKEDLRLFAERMSVEWREDRTNREGDYRRTALRQAILPVIEEAFGEGTSERIAQTAARMRDYLDAGAAFSSGAALDAAAERTPTGWALRLETLGLYAEPERHGVLLDALRRWARAVPRSAATARALDALVGELGSDRA